MPHVVYLHSALHKDRVTAADPAEQRTLQAFNRLDCLIGFGGAGLVNVAMLCVAAAFLHRSGVPAVTGLSGVHAQLGRVAGGGAALTFAVVLLVSGMASSSVGTHAGQVIMAGFMNWRIPVVIRRVVTMVPSLLVLAFAVNTTQALLYSQVILSFGIPFALVPLLVIARDRAALGLAANRGSTTVLLAAVAVLITGLNLFLIYQAIKGGS
jgi:manganese transport protein